MAYYSGGYRSRPEEVEERKDYLGAPIQVSAPVVGGTAPQAPQEGGATGSGWVNLQRYLSAGGDQGRQTAGLLAGKAAEVGDKAVAGVTNLQGQFGKQAGDAATAGTEVQFKSLAEMPEYGEVAGGVKKAEQSAKGLVDFSGRRDLISQQFGGDAGHYSQGMGKYDSFLAGAAGNDILQGTSDAYGGLAKQLGVANDESATLGRDAMAQSADVAARRQGEEAARLRNENRAAAQGKWEKDRAGWGELRKELLRRGQWAAASMPFPNAPAYGSPAGSTPQAPLGTFKKKPTAY